MKSLIIKEKNIFFVFLIVLTVFSLFFVCTGCSNDTVQDRTGYIRFASSDNTRSIEEGNKLMYPAENLYWAYTAVKKDGNYTVGQSEETTGSAVSGVSVSDGGRLLLLKPMKSGPETGLGTVGPFSVGTWVFKLYGYKGCKLDGGVYKFSDLVYTSSKEVVIDNVSIAAAKDVVFELTVDTTTVAKGKLELGRFKMFLPENQKIFGTKPALASDGTPLKAGAEVVVKIFGGMPAADNLIATSTTILTEDKTIDSGAFDISYFAFDTNGIVKNEFSAGDWNLYFVAEYQDEYTYSQKDIVFADGGYKFSGNTDYTKYAYDDGYAPVFDAQAYPVYFRAGVVTTLDGVINEFMGMAESTSSAQYGAYVASKGSGGGIKYYLTLDEAATDTTVTGEITVLRHIKNAGSVTKSCTIVPGNFLVKNLTLSGGSTVVTFKLNSGGTCVFANSAKINLFRNDETNNVELNTAGGDLTVTDANANVLHNGTVSTLKIAAVKNGKSTDLGYHLWADVSTGVEMTAGFLDMGENITVKKLDIKSASGISLKGRLTTTLENMTALRDGAANVGTATGFTKVVLIGGAGSSPAEKNIWGIDGMYVALPSKPLSKTDCLFSCWNRVDTPAEEDEDIEDASLFAVSGTSDIKLYAKWITLQKIGGKIGYVHKNNGASYTFYDGSKNVITFSGEPDVDKLKDAVYYSVSGKFTNTPDMFFVCNTDLFRSDLLPVNISWYGGSDFAEMVGYILKDYTADGVLYTYRYGRSHGSSWKNGYVDEDGVGAGKLNTAYMMNIGKSGYSGNFFKDTYYSGCTGCIWNYLKKMNDPSTAAANKNNTGLYDWYIPSMDEVFVLLGSNIASSSKGDLWTYVSDYVVTGVGTGNALITSSLVGGNNHFVGVYPKNSTYSQLGTSAVSGNIGTGILTKYSFLPIRSF